MGESVRVMEAADVAKLVERLVRDPVDLTTSALITSISTNAPGAHEVPPILLHSMECYCDDRGSTPLIAGEMVLATEEHGWSPADLALQDAAH